MLNCSRQKPICNGLTVTFLANRYTFLRGDVTVVTVVTGILLTYLKKDILYILYKGLLFARYNRYTVTPV